MPNGQAFGFKAAGEFEPAFQAAIRRLGLGAAARRGQLAQGLATRGVRTSGVSAIPEEALGRGEAEAEAGLVGDFALRQALENIEDRRRTQEMAFQREMLPRQFELQESLQRRLGRQQLIGQLIGGGIGAIGSIGGGALSRGGAGRAGGGATNIFLRGG